ncbi:cytochrome c peroxidase [Hypoxylon sp. FL1150]|nr:cytochrome c peroxidase [Hypoxylon sp. FL1150]
MARDQPTVAQLDEVKAAVSTLLCHPNYDDGSADSCSSTKTGGSNGAGMRYDREGGGPANAGLHHARAFLEPIKAKYTWITYADLWTLAAVVALNEIGEPKIAWVGGRTGYTDDRKVPRRGRLPNGALGSNDQDIGAAPSGFDGKWVNNLTRFSNQCFKLLLANEWRKKVRRNGVEQFVYVEESLEVGYGEQLEELMTPPPDYAVDKDLFFDHFAKVFAKLLEPGIQRDAKGKIINKQNIEDGYRSALKTTPPPRSEIRI